MSYPGLVMECDNLMEKYELTDIHTASKIQWKKAVKDAVCKQNKSSLLQKIQNGYKKLDYKTLREEKFETKEYLKSLNLPDARMKFALRSKTTKTVQMNYKGEKKYIKNGWKCQDCEIPDTQDHIVRCPCYQQLRVGKDLTSDKDLVEYFRKVIQIREKSDEK